MDILNETLTFEDGMKLKENKCIKESDDYTDEAFEKLCCSEAGMCTLKFIDEKELSISSSSHILSCSIPVTCPLAVPELGRDLSYPHRVHAA